MGIVVGITFYSSILIVIYDNKYADLASFKQALQSNPITLQYELAEPIISHVRLVSNNQEREVGVKLPNGVCNTYNPSTGITTVRVGKIVLDGSETYIYMVEGKYFVYNFTSKPSETGVIDDTVIKCDNANIYVSPRPNGTGLNIMFPKNSEFDTLEEVKAYFASNPTTRF